MSKAIYPPDFKDITLIQLDYTKCRTGYYICRLVISNNNLLYTLCKTSEQPLF
ncbi:hypothetical protein C0J52_11822 [Blattella germanica]|nr:hypothetical protein C0J52_11822 [Blattella germanica]